MKQKGFSLVEVLVASTIAIGVSMTTIKINSISNKSLNKIKTELSLIEWKNYKVLSVLADPESCYSSLTSEGEDLSMLEDNYSVRLKRDDGSVVAEAGMKILNGNWLIKKVLMKAFREEKEGAKSGMCNIRIDLERGKKGQIGGKHKLIEVPVKCKLRGGNGKLKSCRLFSSESSGYWTESLEEDLSYILRDSVVLIGEADNNIMSEDDNINASLKINHQVPFFWPAGSNKNVRAAIALGGENHSIVFKETGLYELDSCLKMVIENSENGELDDLMSLCGESLDLGNKYILNGKGVVKKGKIVPPTFVSGTNIEIEDSSSVFSFGQNNKLGCDHCVGLGSGLSVKHNDSVVIGGDRLNLLSEGYKNLASKAPSELTMLFSNGYKFFTSKDPLKEYGEEKSSVFISSEGHLGIGKSIGASDDADFASLEKPKVYINGDIEVNGELWLKGRQRFKEISWTPLALHNNAIYKCDTLNIDRCAYIVGSEGRVMLRGLLVANSPITSCFPAGTKLASIALKHAPEYDILLSIDSGFRSGNNSLTRTVRVKVNGDILLEDPVCDNSKYLSLDGITWYQKNS